VGQLRVRGTSADLPVFDPDEELEPVDSLGDSVSGFEFGAASVRALDVGNVRLQAGLRGA
jgi:hypothetical protein